MKKAALMLVITIFLMCGCTKQTASLSFIAMDTYMTLSAECNEETLEKVQDEIMRLEDIFSHSENSELGNLLAETITFEEGTETILKAINNSPALKTVILPQENGIYLHISTI